METDKKLIYFVEDDPLLINMYDLLFKTHGFKLAVSRNGNEGIENLKHLTKKPAVILLDILMPERDGFEVLAFIKQQEELKDIPVIIFTNLSEKNYEDKAYRMGADAYLVKSEYTCKDVIAKIKEYIEKSSR